MLVKSASFVISNTDVAKCPNSKLPEYAFIGRSNVGKSSLINALCNKKKLAKTSSRPGKTQLINHFLINKNWHLVDLPGYGYARVSKSQKKIFQKFITTYFEKRTQLVTAFLLIDIRHEPQPIDLNFMQWLGENSIPFSIVFTKADKLKPNAVERNVALYSEKLLETWEILPPKFITSSTSKYGVDQVLSYIGSLNENLKYTT
jgi:GTP-binding protein